MYSSIEQKWIVIDNQNRIINGFLGHMEYTHQLQ